MEQLLQLEWLGSPLLVGILFLVVTLGAVVQFGIGMGFGVVASPIMALIEPKLVPVPALYIGLFTSLGAAVSARSTISWPEVKLFAFGRLIGSAIASFVLISLTNEKHFLLFFGSTILVALALNLSGIHIPFNRWTLFLISKISGFMATITSVGGPPVALLYASRSAESRGTIGAFFTFGSLFALGALYISGWAGWEETIYTVLLLPPVITGMYLGKRLKGRLDHRFRSILLALSALASITLIVRGLS